MVSRWYLLNLFNRWWLLRERYGKMKIIRVGFRTLDNRLENSVDNRGRRHEVF